MVNSKKKNIDIEFLRAAALLMILVQHAEVFIGSKTSPYWTILRRYMDFWGSVDLFFCVSGFIITRGLIQEFVAESADARYLISRQLGWRRVAFGFWIRRAWRLWPSAWLWIVIALCCSAFFNRSGIFGSLSLMARDGLAAWLHLANFHWAGCYMHGGGSCNFVPSTHVATTLPTGWSLAVYWSLSLEEQFYFLVPLLFFFLPKRWIAGAIALLFVALIPVPRDPLGLAWFVRVDAILVGVAIGWASCVEDPARTEARRQWIKTHRWTVRLLASCMLGGIALIGVPAYATQPGTVTLIALMSGVLVGIARYDADVLIPSWSRPQAALVWVGGRSYCLYLCHMTAYFLAIELWFRLGGVGSLATHIVRVVTAAVLLGIFAEMTARWVETPLRKVGHRKAQHWLSAPAVH